jgi:hypothetical protein
VPGGLSALLCLAGVPAATSAAEPTPAAPCLTLDTIRFGEHAYHRAQTQSSPADYAAVYYRGGERASSWNARIELRSYGREAGRTPLEVAAGVVELERRGNPVLRAAPIALNAEQSVILLDYVTWSDATLHAGYAEIDVFKFFAPAGRAAPQVVGFRYVGKLPIADRSREALNDEIRRQRSAAAQAMLQLPVCAWTVTEPANSA